MSALSVELDHVAGPGEGATSPTPTLQEKLESLDSLSEEQHKSLLNRIRRTNGRDASLMEQTTPTMEGRTEVRPTPPWRDATGAGDDGERTTITIAMHNKNELWTPAPPPLA